MTTVRATTWYLASVKETFDFRFPTQFGDEGLQFYPGYTRDMAGVPGQDSRPLRGEARAEVGIDEISEFDASEGDYNPYVHPGPGFVKMKLQASILVYVDASYIADDFEVEHLTRIERENPSVRAIALAEDILAWVDNQIFMADVIGDREGEGDELTKAVGASQILLVDETGAPISSVLVWRITWRSDFTICLPSPELRRDVYNERDLTGVERIVFYGQDTDGEFEREVAVIEVNGNG